MTSRSRGASAIAVAVLLCAVPAGGRPRTVTLERLRQPGCLGRSPKTGAIACARFHDQHDPTDSYFALPLLLDDGREVELPVHVGRESFERPATKALYSLAEVNARL